MSKHIIPFSVFIFCSFISFGQKRVLDQSNTRDGESVEYCITHKKMNELNQNPEYRKSREKAEMELQELTVRELEVLARLAEGLSPKEVATELKISWDTVRNHITNIYTKLHVHSRSEAILKYLGRKPSVR